MSPDGEPLKPASGRWETRLKELNNDGESEWKICKSAVGVSLGELRWHLETHVAWKYHVDFYKSQEN